MPDKSTDEAYLTAERFRTKIENEFKHKIMPNNAALTISFGIASYPDDGESSEEILRKADAALYNAKRSGKNKVLIYSR